MKHTEQTKHISCRNAAVWLMVSALLLGGWLFPAPSTMAQGKGAGRADVTIDRLPSKDKRFALIIGVDAYQKDISPLYGTVNDAKALRDVLLKYAGFTEEHIILLTTDSNDADLIPTRGNIIDQLDKLQRVVPADGLILFSFSGHGVSIDSDAFIVPSDGRIYQDADLMRERAIDVLRIKRAIQKTPAKQVIMFLDACRNDPVKGKGDVDNNLTPAYASGFSFDIRNQNIEAYATLYATSFGDRAYEFLDKKTNKYRGYFSYAIEEGLKGAAANDQGEVTLAGLIKYIEDTVKERVRINENQKQIPYPTTEGFRNSDLVISVAESNTPKNKIPLWFNRLTIYPIVPGEGLGGLKIGMGEDEVVNLLGKPDEYKSNLWNTLTYKFKKVSLLVFTTPEKQVESFRLIDYDLNNDGLILGIKEGVTLGSSLTQIINLIGVPAPGRTSKSVSCSGVTKLGNSVYYKYSGITFVVCDSNKLVHIIDVQGLKDEK